MDETQTLPRGTVLDEIYTVEGLLGSGGFANTYLAQDRSLGRQIAIKEYFPRDFAARVGLNVEPTAIGSRDLFDSGRERFIKEARTLRSLKHPNIVRVYRSFDAHGTSYIAQELVEGMDLEDWLRLRDTPLTQLEMDRIAIPLLAALEHVHTSKILHRDITPRNIRIRSLDELPVLLDFGAAKNFGNAEHSKTAPIFAEGYAPPESYTRDSDRLGAWTDIYSLAATFYRMLSGHAPPQSPERALGDTLVPAVALPIAANFRTPFLEAIDWALAIQLAKRPQSVQVWREALLKGRARTGNTIVQTRPGRPRPKPQPPAAEREVSRPAPSQAPTPGPTEGELEARQGATRRNSTSLAVTLMVTGIIAITSGAGVAFLRIDVPEMLQRFRGAGAPPARIEPPREVVVLAPTPAPSPPPSIPQEPPAPVPQPVAPPPAPTDPPMSPAQPEAEPPLAPPPPDPPSISPEPETPPEPPPAAPPVPPPQLEPETPAKPAPPPESIPEPPAPAPDIAPAEQVPAVPGQDFLPRHAGAVMSLVSSDAFLATGTEKGAVSLWKRENGVATLQREMTAEKSVQLVALAPGGAKSVAAASEDGSITIWSAARKVNHPTPAGQRRNLLALESLASEKRFAAIFVSRSKTGAFTADVAKWDFEGAALPARTLDTGGAGIDAGVVAPVGDHIALSSRASVMIFSGGKTKPDHTFNIDGTARALAFSNDGRNLAAAGLLDRIFVWKSEATGFGGARMLVLPLSEAPEWSNELTSQVTAVAFSPDGQYLAAATRDNHVLVWDLDRPIRPVVTHSVPRSPGDQELSWVRLLQPRKGVTALVMPWDGQVTWSKVESKADP